MIIAAELSLWVALLMAAWSVIVSSVGGKTRRPELVESGERGLHAVLVLLLTASAGLWTALLTRDFSLWYVATHTSANLPDIYTISAFWAGRGGSLLLWMLILAVYTVIALRIHRCGAGDPTAHVAAVLAAVLLVFMASMALAENPFERLSWLPPEGSGMDPRLQSPWMAIYLPVLYLGYAATAVPFAFAVSALIARRSMPEWLARSRRWATVSWLFMSAGILIGLHWSYTEPDAPGYWLRHPVESAALLPWLVMTAFLLSAAVQENRGVVMRWNVILLMSAFLLAILATVSPGNGTLTGIAPLAQSPGGSWIAAAFAVAIVISGVLVIERLPDVTASGWSATASTRTRYGAYVAAVGIVAFSVAAAAQLFREDREVTLIPGDPVQLTDPYGGEWSFVNEGVSRYLILNRRVTAVTIPVRRNGVRDGLLTTERRQHVDSRGARTYGPSTEPGVTRTVQQDVYAALVGMAGEDAVEVRIAFNPLAWLVWVGGAVTVIGGVLAFWPRSVAPRQGETAT